MAEVSLSGKLHAAAGVGLGKEKQSESKEVYAARYNVVLYPHPVLRTACQVVPSDEVEDLPELEKMMSAVTNTYAASGLSGPQVGLPLRVIYLSTTQWTGLLINPAFTPDESAGKSAEREGCLSLPGLQLSITRWQRGVLTGRNAKNEPVSVECGLELARVAQHEIDHVNGMLIIDRVGQAQRMVALKAYRGAVKKYRKVMKRLQARRGTRQAPQAIEQDHAKGALHLDSGATVVEDAAQKGE